MPAIFSMFEAKSGQNVVFDQKGYIRTSSTEKQKFTQMQDGRILIYGGVWDGYYLGCSGDHGYVMAYGKASQTEFSPLANGTATIRMDGHDVSQWTDGYYYCSGRWQTGATLFQVKYI